MKHWKPVLATLLGVGLVFILIASLIIWHGFGTVDAPSASETLVARAVRNFSIPRVERRKQNPMLNDAEVLQQGQELYRSRCAVCHGIDGSGMTPIGTNVYPRVPDLRLPETQNLSDGEIHYFIKGGVRFSAMPGQLNGHREGDGDSWKLTSYVRSLKPLSGEAKRVQTRTIASAHYVGSQACEHCHQDIYQRWKKTPMANIVRDPREHPEAILPDLATNHVAPFTVDQVLFVYGSVWKQRYFTKVGDSYAPLPVQWDIKTRQWLPYHVPDKGADWWAQLYPESNLKRPTGPTCDGCHSVDYNIQTKQVAEWNVGCERCHGPGSEHTAHPTRGNIVNPAQMDSFAENDTCIQCHSQGRPPGNPIAGKYYDWPVGYKVGLRLADFWKLENCTLGQTDFYYFPDCTAHKNRMQGNDFRQSVMYRHEITCSSCHDVHGTANYAQLIKPANQICLDCHGPLSPNGPHTATLEAHTHHREGTPGSECVDCHMPAIESEGVPGAMVHAHTFRFISPAMTEKYGIPNACTSCHTGKSTGWATAALRSWPEVSAWRIE